jgi:hypothetical protein
MQIKWNGFSSFEISCKTPNGTVELVTDPYQNTTGLRFPRTLEAQLLLTSHDEEDANNLAAVTGEPYLIDLPGEFEVKGVFVYGINAPLKREEKGKAVKNLIFRIEAEDMQIAHLGALDRPLTDEELQKLNNVDILMIPVGGGRVMDAKTAAQVISQVEPRIIIPMTHDLPSVKEDLAGVETFCKEMGACRKEEANKFKISRKKLPQEDMLIMTLSR